MGLCKKCRMIAVISTWLIFGGLLIFLLAFFVYSMSKQLKSDGMMSISRVFFSYFRSFSESLKEMDEGLSKLNLGDGFLVGQLEQLRGLVEGNIQQFFSNMMVRTVNFSAYMIKFGLGIIVSIYFLIDKNTFVLYGNVIGRILLPKKFYEKMRSFYHDADVIFSGYVRGQTADVVFMILSISVLLGVIGIKYGILIGCVAGICNYIPYAGPFVAYAGTILFGLLNGQEKQVLIALILLFLLQQVDGSYIGPKLMGKSVEIEPIFVFLGVILGGSILGFLGMILAVPITALCKLIFLRFLEKRLVQRQKEERER